MSKPQKLVNKMKRRQRYVKEATESTFKMNKQEEMLQGSPGAHKLMRGAQRRLDASFGYDMTGHEPALDYRAIAGTLERFDYDADSGSDFGIRLTISSVAAVAEVTDITCVADVAGSLNSTYFLYNTPENQYYVWYNVNAAGVDPAVANRTGVMVALATNALDTAVASATQAAMHALSDVNATVLGAVVSAENTKGGSVADAANGAASPGFTFMVTTQGANASGGLIAASGIQPGDSVHVLEGALAGRMLEVVANSSSAQLRLDDVSTFTTPESNVACRFIMSGEKKSYR